MRMSHRFGRTLREAPSEAVMPSHQLCVRAGLIRQLSQGIYSYLPMGWRVMQRIAAIIREEMDGIGGQELSMPIVHPAELWRASDRYDAPAPGPTLFRLTDRVNHEMVLAMTHEEAAADLARQEIHSYKQLPMMVYQIQTKLRDEARSRGGLVRVREFLMKDAYTFSANTKQLDAQYQDVYDAYLRIYARCGLDVIPVQAATGMMGGKMSHEFMVENPLGEDTLILCDACEYAANSETAHFDKGTIASPEPEPLEMVATPGTTTIQAVADYVGVGTDQTLKAVFMATPEGEVVFAVIRGDLEVSEAKLSAALGDVELAAATPEQLEARGLVAGYASPIGVEGVTVVADDSIRLGGNFVVGANKPGYHYRGANYPRDFEPDILTDIALARDGDRCPECGAHLRTVRGIEVGHVFKLGTRYSEALGANYLDREGRSHPVIMGSYGIGLGRLLACVIEQHHDEYGIIWPHEAAPYDVYLACLAKPGSDTAQAAEALYERLIAAGFEVLYDDRNERAGVKFNDADLLGVPLRLTVSTRTVSQEAVEFKLREESERQMLPLDGLEERLAALLAASI